MELDQETLAKLTTALSGDIELYNQIINAAQQNKEKVTNLENELSTTKSKFEEAEGRGKQYLEQISNLLSKIPVSNNTNTITKEQKFEEIMNRTWSK